MHLELQVTLEGSMQKKYRYNIRNLFIFGISVCIGAIWSAQPVFAACPGAPTSGGSCDEGCTLQTMIGVSLCLPPPQTASACNIPATAGGTCPAECILHSISLPPITGAPITFQICLDATEEPETPMEGTTGEIGGEASAPTTTPVAPIGTSGGTTRGAGDQDVTALPTDAAVITLQNPLGNITTIPQFIGNIIAAALGLVGSLALLMFVVGAFEWLTAAGSSEKIQKGARTMTMAAIGLFVIFASYGILQTILSALTGAGS